MTMRLDIVTNDAGENVRREHARELGAGVVVAIYRLAKLAQLHDLTNQAFTRQLEQTHQIIGDYCLRSGSNVNVLFAHKAVFVAGQLLKGSRGTYEAATELGELFERLGGFSELYVQRDLTREELLAFAEQISIAHRSGAGGFRSPTPKIRLRQVADSARLRGLELEDLTPDQRIVRMYASAVVIMRRFYEDLQQSRYILPRRIKRIAQSLVDLSNGSTPAFLGVTEVRNANFDEAGRAVNSAILAVSMAREVTSERVVLSQIAMAAMMHDVARPRALALMAAAGPAMPGMQGPTTLSEDQEDRLAAGAAAVLTALGRVNEPSITRTVLAFEALWLRRQTWLGPVYWGARAPTLHAKIIQIARRYNDLLTPEPGLAPPTPDYAVAVLSDELKEPQDRTVLRMLVSALGLLPLGTVVQLSTGEVAEIVRGPKGPGEKPRVRIVADAHGQHVSPVELELAQDTQRQVARVMSVEGWRKGLELRPGGDMPPPPDSDYGSDRPPAPPPQVAARPPAAQGGSAAAVSAGAIPPPGGTAHASATSRSIADQYADQYASWGDEAEPEPPPREASSSFQSSEHNSSASLPSMGSSPSAVAEAMGRMINDSLRPPAATSRDNERTLFQHGDDIADRATSRPGKGRTAREPTARGTLAATPLPHVLVYMLDHALTGSVVFEGGEGENTIYFVAGVPTKIRLHDPVALLGEVLVHGGAIEAKAVEHAVDGARRLGILLGEYLVGHDLVSREALSWALEAQLLTKTAYLANLAPEISYAYYRDLDLLEGWGGGDIGVGNALNPILASVRNWLDRARIRATLNRIGKHPLVIHEDAALANLALTPDEQTALDVIRNEALPLAQLFKRNVAGEEVVSSLVYSLAVTRQFSFKGQKKGPMPSASGAPRSSSNAPAPTSGSMPVPDSMVPSAPPSPAASGAVATSARSGASSSSRPNAAASVPKVAAAGAADVGARASGSGASPSPVSVRKPAQSAPFAAATPARPGAALPRANPPQIRPIGSKKGTMVGLQPAVPAEARQAQPRTAAAPPAASTARPPEGSGLTSSTPPDGMKTIALASPAFKGQVRRPSPTGATPPGATPRPTPASAGAIPRAATAPGGKATQPSVGNVRAAAPAASGTPSAARVPVTRPAGGPPPSSRSRQVAAPPSGSGAARGAGAPGSSRSDAFDIDDEGLADAEAALEAMQSFRSAEAALQRGDMASAERLAQKAVDGDPSQADYVTLLAWIRAHAGGGGAVESAIMTMTRVLSDDPSNERALLYRGKLYVRANRVADAAADFNELLAANPQHREAAAELRQLKQRP